MISNSIDYELRQTLQLATGKTAEMVIASGRNNNTIDNLFVLRDGYRLKGYDVDVVKTTRNVKTEVVDD